MKQSEQASGEIVTKQEGHGPRETESTLALVKEALADVKEIVKTHVELAHAELRADLKAELTTAKGLGIGALAALTGLNLLLVTGIIALGLVMPAWAAGLIVTGGVLLVGGVAAGVAWSKRVREPIRRTRRELKEDVRWTKERMA